MRKKKLSFSLVELMVMITLMGFLSSLIEVSGDALWADMALEGVTRRIVSDIRHVRYLAMRHGGYGAVRFFQIDGDLGDLISMPVSVNSGLRIFKWLVLPDGSQPEEFYSSHTGAPWPGGFTRYQIYSDEEATFESTFFTFTGLDSVNESGSTLTKNCNSIDYVGDFFFVVAFNSKGDLAPLPAEHNEAHLADEQKFKISDGTRSRIITVQTNGSVFVTKE